MNRNGIFRVIVQNGPSPNHYQSILFRKTGQIRPQMGFRWRNQDQSRSGRIPVTTHIYLIQSILPANRFFRPATLKLATKDAGPPSPQSLKRVQTSQNAAPHASACAAFSFAPLLNRSFFTSSEAQISANRANSELSIRPNHANQNAALIHRRNRRAGHFSNRKMCLRMPFPPGS